MFGARQSNASSGRDTRTKPLGPIVVLFVWTPVIVNPLKVRALWASSEVDDAGWRWDVIGCRRGVVGGGWRASSEVGDAGWGWDVIGRRRGVDGGRWRPFVLGTWLKVCDFVDEVGLLHYADGGRRVGRKGNADGGRPLEGEEREEGNEERGHWTAQVTVSWQRIL